MMEHKMQLGDMTFAAFDLETTGIDPLRDKIIEVGIAVFQRTNILKTVETLINPEVSIPKFAFDIHGIDDSMVQNQPLLKEILPELFLTLSGTTPLAHNASFDLSFLLEGAKQQEIDLFTNPIIDTCVLSRHIFPQFEKHGLQALIQKLNLTQDQSHRALSDAKSCFSLFCRAVQELPFKWDTPWEDFSSLYPCVFSIDLNRFPLPEKFFHFGKALETRKRLLLSYRDGQGRVTEREITPMGLSLDVKQRMVLFGYCHLRQGTRTFRLDRILEMQIR